MPEQDPITKINDIVDHANVKMPALPSIIDRRNKTALMQTQPVLGDRGQIQPKIHGDLVISSAFSLKPPLFSVHSIEGTAIKEKQIKQPRKPKNYRY